MENSNEKGFTLIEIIIALMVLSILLIALINMDSMAFNTNLKSINKDVEYNISHSVCEKIKSEIGSIDNKTVVVYINELSELTQNISEVFLFGENVADINYNTIKNNNYLNKKFAVIMCKYDADYLNMFKITTLSMMKADSGVTLRLAR